MKELQIINQLAEGNDNGFIRFPTGFNIISNMPIDSRLILNKEQMREANSTTSETMLIPNHHFVVCSEDDRIYIYDETNEIDIQTGKFRLLTENLPVTDNETIAVKRSSSENQDIKYILSIKGKEDAGDEAVLRKHINNNEVTYTWDAIYDKNEVYNKNEIDNSLSAKQDALTAGNSITITSNSSGSNKITTIGVSVDSSLSIDNNSTNPVENKVVSSQINTIIDKVGGTKIGSSTVTQGSLEQSISNLETNKQDKLIQGTNISILNNTISATDTGATSVELNSGNIGNVVTGITYDSDARKITYTKDITALTQHQDIKALDTTATTSQSTNSNESITGNGTITLHKIAKTGDYSDLSNTPTIPVDTNQKIKTSSVTFGNDDVVEIVGGTNVSVIGDADTKTITISTTNTQLRVFELNDSNTTYIEANPQPTSNTFITNIYYTENNGVYTLASTFETNKTYYISNLTIINWSTTSDTTLHSLGFVYRGEITIPDAYKPINGNYDYLSTNVILSATDAISGNYAPEV